MWKPEDDRGPRGPLHRSQLPGEPGLPARGRAAAAPRCATLIPLVLLALAAVTPGEARDEWVATVLAESLDGSFGGAEQLSRDLAALGSDALPGLLDVLTREGVVVGGVEVPLDPVRLDAVLAAFERLPPDEVRAQLTALAAGAYTVDERRASLSVLGRAGGWHDLHLLLALASPADPEQPVPLAVRGAVDEALGQLLVRHPALVGQLRSTYDDARPALRVQVAKAVAGVGSAAALEALGDLLRRDSASDPVLLIEIARLAARVPHPVPPGVATDVRGYLSDRDSGRVQLAVLALGALEDHDSFPDLFALLEGGDANLRAVALRALQGISGLGLPAEPSRWRAWHKGELAWWRDESPGVMADLSSHDDLAAAAAIVELSRHRLYRHELAEALRGALRGPSEELRALACGVAADLGSALLLPDLVHMLEDRDERVRSGAHAALRRMTGADLPSDAAVWAELLD